MKLRIKGLKLENKNGQYGPYRQFVFQNELDGMWVYASEKKGFTDNFRVGYEFEVADGYIQKKTSNSGRPYLSIKWPKMNEQSNVDLTEVIKRLDDIGIGVNRILNVLTDTHGESPFQEGLPTGDAPPHTDGDAPVEEDNDRPPF